MATQLQTSIKRFSYIVRILVAVLAGLYLALMVLFNLPQVRSYLSETISAELSRKLGTSFRVGDVHVASINRIDLKDVCLLDHQNDSLFKSKRVSAQFNFSDLLHRKQIIINHLDLFDTFCKIYRPDEKTACNYQFVIDSLSSPSSDSKGKIELLIRTLMVRNLNLRYDCLDKKRIYDQLDPNHLNLTKVDADMRINKVAKDTLNVRLRNICLKEQCGLDIKRLAFNFVAGPSETNVYNFSLKLPHSFVEIKQVHAVNERRNKKLDFRHNRFSDVEIKGEWVPSELAFLYKPLKAFGDTKYKLSARVNKEGPTVSVASNLNTVGCDDLSLQASAVFDIDKWLKKRANIKADIHQLYISSNHIKQWMAVLNSRAVAPEVIDRVKFVSHQGTFFFGGKKMMCKGTTSTHLGMLKESISCDNSHLRANVESNGFDIGALLNVKPQLGYIDGSIEAYGILKPSCKLNFRSHINRIAFNHHVFGKIHLDGIYSPQNLDAKLNVADADLDMDLQGKYVFGSSRQLMAKADIRQLNPKALRLEKFFTGDSVSAKLFADVQSLSPTLIGTASIRRFKMHENGREYGFDSLVVASRARNGLLATRVQSDMLEMETTGNVAFTDIPAEFYRMIKNEMHMLPELFPSNKKRGEYAYFDMRLKKTAFLEHLFKLPVRFEEMPHFSGYFNQAEDKLKFSAFIPTFYMNDSRYKEGSIYITNDGDSLNFLGHITKQFNKEDVEFVLDTRSFGSSVLSELKWKALRNNSTHGSLKAKSTFSSDETGNYTHIEFYPSEIYVHDSLWQVSPSAFDIRKGDYQIRNFKIGRNNQYITLNSTANGLGGKGLEADLKGIDLGYVFDILNFHPVELTGIASGRILTGDMAANKDVRADLVVDGFRFNTGDMGKLQLAGLWNNEEGKIHLDAKSRQADDDSTLIKGYVDISNNEIDLRFNSVRTNLGFLNWYLSSIFADLDGRTSGYLRLFGPLSSMDFEGREKIDYLTLTPRVLNTTYHITNDSIIFSPGKIHFKNMTLKDTKGSSGHINGDVMHRKLHNFRFDIGIDADNLLVYDWNDRETDTFWGTVMADGTCRLSGSTDELHVNLDMTPRAGSTFVYDSSSPGGNGDNKEFIHFVTPGEQASVMSDEKHNDKDNENKRNQGDKDSSADIFLDFNINATPDASLVILTDNKTGDRMSLNGSGPLHINYYNKGKFSIFGTYTLDKGLYRITIRDIIHKAFTMQKGGTIRFNGSPMDGDLNLKGIYTINSVSLGDLNLGNLNNSSSANVDCIVLFKGKCGEPQVSFDLDIPNVNEDEKQMVRNMISSQGDMNMQIIYLLSIGRFFTYDYANFNGGTQNQSTVAMQSLLASTLSEQFNSMLSNALHISNWKFGTSIATGRMGWSDMEVEGLLSGSLLDNRVLINGNFGYRDQPTYSNNFVGDFNIRWLLTKSGIISLKAYSETNDRYFTKTSLTTNGVGLLFQKDFDTLRDFFKIGKKKK